MNTHTLFNMYSLALSKSGDVCSMPPACFTRHVSICQLLQGQQPLLKIDATCRHADFGVNYWGPSGCHIRLQQAKLLVIVVCGSHLVPIKLHLALQILRLLLGSFLDPSYKLAVHASLAVQTSGWVLDIELQLHKRCNDNPETLPL